MSIIVEVDYILEMVLAKAATLVVKNARVLPNVYHAVLNLLFRDPFVNNHAMMAIIIIAVFAHYAHQDALNALRSKIVLYAMMLIS